MMNTDHRNIQRKPDTVSHGIADKQRSGESGTFCDGDGILILRHLTGFLHNLVEQRNNASNVVTAGKFRHDTAVQTMHFDLRMKRICNKTFVRVVKGNTRFVTGRFNSEDQHSLCR